MQASHIQSARLHMRLSHPQDEPFLFQLFFESHQLPAGTPGTESQWRSLIEMQYRGRKMTYNQRFPDAEDSILTDANGAAVGRILVDRKLERWRIVDIAVLRAYRARGLATTALIRLQQECARERVGLELQVMPGNPARRLYERLGFCATHEDSVAVHMIWNAAEEDKPGESRN